MLCFLCAEGGVQHQQMIQPQVQNVSTRMQPRSAIVVRTLRECNGHRGCKEKEKPKSQKKANLAFGSTSSSVLLVVASWLHLRQWTK